MDFSRYFPPGVYTETIPGPQIGIQASTPSSVAIFGDARGYQTDLQTVVIPADFTDTGGAASAVNTPVLRQMGIDTTSLVVVNLASGLPYAVNTDYTIVPVTGPSGTQPNFDTTYAIHRVIGGGLGAGISVQVSYNFTNEFYYQPQRISDPSDIISLYGPAFDTSGNIVSELTLAAQLAFINGASTVITAAVGGSGTPDDYKAALATFEGIADIAIVVCANGNSNNFGAIRDHVVLQSSLKNERRAILGTDGATTTVTSATRIAAAQAIQNSRVAMVSPSAIQYYNPSISQSTAIGSQYLAAAIAGVAVSQSIALPLTRKQVGGFLSVDIASDAQKSLETQSGLMVVDSNNSTSALRIRHGVTTNPSTLVTREWSILGQQDAMAYRLRAYFESDGLIGSIITDITLANVKASADSALQALVSDGIINSYQGLKVRQSGTAFDAIQISYEWQASLPLNYIVVQFTLDVTTGDTTDTTTSI